MGQDALLLGGTIAGFFAAVLSILEKLLNLKDRLRSVEDRKDGGSTERSPADRGTVDREAADRAPRVRQPTWRLINVSSYLLFHELAVIIAAGLLLNYLGLMLSLRLQSILYLDMTGTALVAFLLGPWWGALVALLSSSLVNWLLYPEPGADLIIFPWASVNMTGGLFWGFLARQAGFRKYLRTPRASALSHSLYLFGFGVVGAGVMSVPGTFVQAALSEPEVFALNPDVARALEGVIAGWQDTLQDQLEALFGVALADSMGWGLLSWFHNWLRYIPDKTLGIAIALAVLKYGFPLFERELIHGGPSKRQPFDTAAAPIILGCLYLPTFIALILTDEYAGARYWPLWSMPWLTILGGGIALWRWGPSDDAVRQACRSRAERYAQALRPIDQEPAHEFGQRLTIATLLMTVIFTLCLPLLLMDFYRVAFNFFCVVYGFLLAVYLVRIAISQNLSVARSTK